MRKQPEKILPSGTTPNYAYTFPEEFGGSQCLNPVDLTVIDAILRDMKGEFDTLTDWNVPPEFALRAERTAEFLHIREITLPNVWITFAAMIHYL
jgi:hypothetical protein